jgi:SAM-dependent methyltransferase
VIKPYKRFSKIYDSHWGNFSKQYVDWINRLLKERDIIKGRILDLACGTGVLAIELAQCGHRVHGIDISAEMIEKARAKSAGLSNISFDIQDMTRFKIEGNFDLIACTFDSINYVLHPDQLRRMFSRVASVLSESGLFIFDSNTKAIYQSHSNETTKHELDGESVIEYCKYDSVQNEGRTAFSFSDGTYEIHRQRPYDNDELSPLLKAAGLHTIHLFSWFDIIPYVEEAATLFYVTEKRS